jgi:hypothetical protein
MNNHIKRFNEGINYKAVPPVSPSQMWQDMGDELTSLVNKVAAKYKIPPAEACRALKEYYAKGIFGEDNVYAKSWPKK